MKIKSTGKVTITEPAIKYWRGVSASPLKYCIALDKVTAPLLVAPVPGARPLYFGINFVGGVGLNIAAQKARGEDNFNYHDYVSRPKKLMDPKDIESRKKANEELNKIFYNGSKKMGKY